MSITDRALTFTRGATAAWNRAPPAPSMKPRYRAKRRISAASVQIVPSAGAVAVPSGAMPMPKAMAPLTGCPSAEMIRKLAR